MKTVLTGLLLTSVSMGASASSYVTGNIQFHDHRDFHGSSMTSTLEAGHTFETFERGGLTVLTEFDGIQIGDTAEGKSSNPYITIGAEQTYNFTDDFWGAIGYHHLLHDGDTVQLRPLFKIGYNFDSGIGLSNRTRFHIDRTDAPGASDDTRTDNAISYQLHGYPVQLKYNNVYMWKAEKMDHEIRSTYTRVGVQPYIEFRNQGDNSNNAFVLGASVAF